MDLAKLVVYSARRYEAEPAIAFAGGVVTYKALMGATAAAVQVIETLRLPARSVVVLDIRNPVFHSALIYALALCGHLSASVGNAAGLERTGPPPALVLTDREDLKPPPGLPVRRIDGRWFAHDESRPVDYEALLAKPGFPDRDQVFRLIYSSGTTGRPKCVGLSNRVLEVRISHAALQAPYRSGTGARAKLCNHVITVYGSTEMGRATNAEPGDLERHEGAVGTPMPFVSLQVVDEGGAVLPAGQAGEIRVKTEELAVYVDEAGQPVPMTDEDGWFHTGDVGHFEANGQLVLTGRTTEIINRGGVVVAPEAIEEVLRAYPGVEDVAVVGVPGVNGVDEIWAAVVPSGSLDAQGLLNMARQRLMERAPDRVFQLGRLPRAESGKMQRNAVRDELIGRAKA